VSRIAFAALGLAAIALAASLVLESAPGDGDAASSAAPARPAVMPINRAHGSAADHTDEWMAAALARPLFSPSRRPSSQAVTAAAAAPFADLPRLSGILVTPTGRSAIFAPSGGGKPVVATEGSTLGTYVVRSIEPEQVTLAGPKGTRVLHPAFDRPPAAPVPLPVLLPRRSADTGPPGRSGVAGGFIAESGTEIRSALENPK
jgi:hypothetical protein